MKDRQGKSDKLIPSKREYTLSFPTEQEAINNNFKLMWGIEISRLINIQLDWKESMLCWERAIAIDRTGEYHYLITLKQVESVYNHKTNV